MKNLDLIAMGMEEMNEEQLADVNGGWLEWLIFIDERVWDISGGLYGGGLV